MVPQIKLRSEPNLSVDSGVSICSSGPENNSGGVHGGRKSGTRKNLPKLEINNNSSSMANVKVSCVTPLSAGDAIDRLGFFPLASSRRGSMASNLNLKTAGLCKSQQNLRFDGSGNLRRDKSLNDLSQGLDNIFHNTMLGSGTTPPKISGAGSTKPALKPSSGGNGLLLQDTRSPSRASVVREDPCPSPLVRLTPNPVACHTYPDRRIYSTAGNKDFHYGGMDRQKSQSKPSIRIGAESYSSASLVAGNSYGIAGTSGSSGHHGVSGPDTIVDDTEVYHTITGGRTRMIAASRPAIPFAPIIRRQVSKSPNSNVPTVLGSPSAMSPGSMSPRGRVGGGGSTVATAAVALAAGDNVEIISSSPNVETLITITATTQSNHDLMTLTQLTNNPAAARQAARTPLRTVNGMGPGDQEYDLIFPMTEDFDRLDVESVEDDNEDSNLTEEANVIQSALLRLDQRHMQEMETLQRRMEEQQRQYMKLKETYREQLSTLQVQARRTQEQELIAMEQNQQVQLRQLQEQKDMLQQQINQQLLQQQQSRAGSQLGVSTVNNQHFQHQVGSGDPGLMLTGSNTASHPHGNGAGGTTSNPQTRPSSVVSLTSQQPVLQPVPRIAYPNPVITQGAQLMQLSGLPTLPEAQQVAGGVIGVHHQLTNPLLMANQQQFQQHLLTGQVAQQQQQLQQQLLTGHVSQQHQLLTNPQLLAGHQQQQQQLVQQLMVAQQQQQQLISPNAQSGGRTNIDHEEMVQEPEKLMDRIECMSVQSEPVRGLPHNFLNDKQDSVSEYGAANTSNQQPQTTANSNTNAMVTGQAGDRQPNSSRSNTPTKNVNTTTTDGLLLRYMQENSNNATNGGATQTGRHQLTATGGTQLERKISTGGSIIAPQEMQQQPHNNNGMAQGLNLSKTPVPSLAAAMVNAGHHMVNLTCEQPGLGGAVQPLQQQSPRQLAGGAPAIPPPQQAIYPSPGAVGGALQMTPSALVSAVASSQAAAGGGIIPVSIAPSSLTVGMTSGGQVAATQLHLIGQTAANMTNLPMGYGLVGGNLVGQQQMAPGSQTAITGAGSDLIGSKVRASHTASGGMPAAANVAGSAGVGGIVPLMLPPQQQQHQVGHDPSTPAPGITLPQPTVINQLKAAGGTVMGPGSPASPPPSAHPIIQPAAVSVAATMPPQLPVSLAAAVNLSSVVSSAGHLPSSITGGLINTVRMSSAASTGSGTLPFNNSYPSLSGLPAALTSSAVGSNYHTIAGYSVSGGANNVAMLNRQAGGLQQSSGQVTGGAPAITPLTVLDNNIIQAQQQAQQQGQNTAALLRLTAAGMTMSHQVGGNSNTAVLMANSQLPPSAFNNNNHHHTVNLGGIGVQQQHQPLGINTLAQLHATGGGVHAADVRGMVSPAPLTMGHHTSSLPAATVGTGMMVANRTNIGPAGGMPLMAGGDGLQAAAILHANSMHSAPGMIASGGQLGGINPGLLGHSTLPHQAATVPTPAQQQQLAQKQHQQQVQLAASAALNTQHLNLQHQIQQQQQLIHHQRQQLQHGLPVGVNNGTGGGRMMSSRPGSIVGGAMQQTGVATPNPGYASSMAGSFHESVIADEAQMAGEPGQGQPES